ncbi:MAG TPA: pseudouridine synthase, partial [Verrucomicrobiae bacterium]|nr:pseudouridine synthase [Verrucomicrobiae bacterium]
MNSIRNIAAYKFASLSDLKSLRGRLLAFCKASGIKGTILLSTEGINLFVAGAREKIDFLLSEIRSIPGLESLAPKVSHSERQPFSRMLVRIKKEIIAFGVDGIDPARSTSPKLPAKTLKQWLDEGREVTLLDTRNDYEVKLGSFKNALPIGIDHFRHFPEAVRKLPPALKEQPVVLFCTGGIRCEKAGPFMQREGFQNIFQLEGGILKYFEECGSAHYQGECFVFDQRVGLDPSLRQTDSTQCFHCLTPLTSEEQNDKRYLPGKSCPYCYQTSQEQTAASVARRHETIRRLINPLPGSEPYDNFRPLTVPAHCDGCSLIESLVTIFKHVPRVEWERIIASGVLLNSNHEPVSASRAVRSGERYLHKTAAIIEPAVNANIEILHEDEAIIVLNKPAPLPMHPSGRFNRNTLQFILNQVYYPQKPRPAHRLDANTTGLCLVARTRHFASLLQPQFERGLIKKTYLARVHGTPTEDFFICDAPISAEPGQFGAREIDHLSGLAARTEFTVLERAGDGSALLEARPITGRTNQIRAHLWDLGLPISGDPIYLAGRKLGAKQTLDLSDPP